MRLIDADAIPYCEYDLDNYHSFRAVEDTVIDEMPTVDPMKYGYVPIEVVRQIQWERDIAMSYLEEAGVGFGENAELQRVKHGKWIDIEEDIVFCFSINGNVGERQTTVVHERKCSLCDYLLVDDATPYCPNCGAKMGGE